MTENTKTNNIDTKRTDLFKRLHEINDLASAAALLNWDQTTYMPPGGGAARGRQLATLQRLAHEKFTDPAVGKLLDDLNPYAENLPYDADDAALIRLTRRNYENATKVPSDFVSEIASHTAALYEIWTTARPANDFAVVQPFLEKTLELSRRFANFFPGYEHIADPLIDQVDYGMKVSTIRPLFAELRAALTPLVKAIGEQSPVDTRFLHQFFPEADQLAAGIAAIKKFGYDFQRGRQDKTHHPFMTKFSLGDVRITTRVNEHDLGDALFSTMHESGHALYEQGISPQYEGTPLAEGTSSGVHESQSRLWENIVGRSLGFWQYYYPKLQTIFPAQLREVPLETFYRAINQVERSLIRTDADEVTYNLHVIIRFDLELALLEGKLAIADLPDAWQEQYSTSLGIMAPDNRDGVLQDVHWYGGLIGGAFQGYTLGNIMASQFYAAALQAHPGIPGEITHGQFSTLHTWLRENIYQHGSKFTTTELLHRVTGGPLSLNPYIDYLRNKYGTIYQLS
ncbi:MAG: carboxypeptidase M32 [Chloroflexi bacterium]|nr:carboxypeptidase M32 [Chloroflexota bacterium]